MINSHATNFVTFGNEMEAESYEVTVSSLGDSECGGWELGVCMEVLLLGFMTVKKSRLLLENKPLWR